MDKKNYNQLIMKFKSHHMFNAFLHYIIGIGEL